MPRRAVVSGKVIRDGLNVGRLHGITDSLILRLGKPFGTRCFGGLETGQGVCGRMRRGPIADSGMLRERARALHSGEGPMHYIVGDKQELMALGKGSYPLFDFPADERDGDPFEPLAGFGGPSDLPRGKRSARRLVGTGRILLQIIAECRLRAAPAATTQLAELARAASPLQERPVAQ